MIICWADAAARRSPPVTSRPRRVRVVCHVPRSVRRRDERSRPVTPPSALASSEYRLPAVVRSLPVIVELKLSPFVQPLFLTPMDDRRLGKWSPMKNGRTLYASLHDTAGTVAFNPVARGETAHVLVVRGP
jgi:hypothetical protein